MKKWLRRIRGAIGMGLTWATGWAPVGAVTGWITGLFLGFPLGGIAFNYAVMFGVLGFVGGTIFSTVLRITEGRRTFDELSLPRFTAWGALGGLVLGGLSVMIGLLGPGLGLLDAVMAGVATLLGAGSAAGTLAIARKADDRWLLEPGGEETRPPLAGGSHRGLRPVD